MSKAHIILQLPYAGADIPGDSYRRADKMGAIYFIAFVAAVSLRVAFEMRGDTLAVVALELLTGTNF